MDIATFVMAPNLQLSSEDIQHSDCQRIVQRLQYLSSKTSAKAKAKANKHQSESHKCDKLFSGEIAKILFFISPVIRACIDLRYL